MMIMMIYDGKLLDNYTSVFKEWTVKVSMKELQSKSLCDDEK